MTGFGVAPAVPQEARSPEGGPAAALPGAGRRG